MTCSPWLMIDETAPVIPNVERESVHDGIRIRFLRYFSHKIGEFPLEMAAILAIPSTPGPHPALLHLHGGAQSAKAEIALAWAQKGYVTLCPDWSVPANTPQAAHATRWPENTPPTHAVHLEADQATIGHIVRAARHGISLLCGRPEVRPDRIGMVGISWGGLMTWLVNGTDTRLRAAIAAYGSGRAPDVALSDSWRQHFQPEAVAHSQTAPILHLNGTHDFFGHLATSEALLEKIGSKVSRLYVANEDHGLSEAARNCAHAWLTCHLHEDGNLPPPPDLQPAPNKRFHHARSIDRTAVWREVPPERLPETGCLYATETHPNGLAFSTPVRIRVPEAPQASETLWDHSRHGLDGFFLRWEQENLGVHAPAKAQLTLTPEGVRFSPPVLSMRIFLRCEPVPLAEKETLRITLSAPAGTRVGLRSFPRPEIDDTKARAFSPQICREDGFQTLMLHPEPRDSDLRLNVLCLDITVPEASPASGPTLHSVTVGP
jgi:dienelactone hydrolase